jgi:hypothetical protein
MAPLSWSIATARRAARALYDDRKPARVGLHHRDRRAHRHLNSVVASVCLQRSRGR